MNTINKKRIIKRTIELERQLFGIESRDNIRRAVNNGIKELTAYNATLRAQIETNNVNQYHYL